MSKPKAISKKKQAERAYESSTVALESLRLIAAPDPKDDLSDEQLADYCHKHKYSSELIQHLIDYVKTL